MDRRFLNLYEILFHKAKTDLSAAKILYEQFNSGEGELDLEVIYFHLQQCAEKLLKALLSKYQVNFPKVHDLEILLNLVNENNIDFKPDKELMIELSDYAVEGRYAVIQEDLDDVPKFFHLLEESTLTVEKLLKN